jgi:hypothetical protein
MEDIILAIVELIASLFGASESGKSFIAMIFFIAILIGVMALMFHYGPDYAESVHRQIQDSTKIR